MDEPRFEPDLDELIEAGLSLTEALSFWSFLVALPPKDAVNWRDILKAGANRESSF